MKSEQTSRLKKLGKKLVRGVKKTFGFFRARSQLSFAQKIIKKSLKLANVVQLAQMYTFAPNPGKNSSSDRAISYQRCDESTKYDIHLSFSVVTGSLRLTHRKHLIQHALDSLDPGEPF